VKPFILYGDTRCDT